MMKKILLCIFFCIQLCYAQKENDLSFIITECLNAHIDSIKKNGCFFYKKIYVLLDEAKLISNDIFLKDTALIGLNKKDIINKFPKKFRKHSIYMDISIELRRDSLYVYISDFCFLKRKKRNWINGWANVSGVKNIFILNHSRQWILAERKEWQLIWG